MCLTRQHLIKTNPHMICKQFFFNYSALPIRIISLMTCIIPWHLPSASEAHEYMFIFLYLLFYPAQTFKDQNPSGETSANTPRRCPRRDRALQDWGARGTLVPAVAGGTGGTAPRMAPSGRQGCFQIPVAAGYVGTIKASSFPVAMGSTFCISACELCPKQSWGWRRLCGTARPRWIGLGRRTRSPHQNHLDPIIGASLGRKEVREANTPRLRQIRRTKCKLQRGFYAHLLLFSREKV